MRQKRTNCTFNHGLNQGYMPTYCQMYQTEQLAKPMPEASTYPMMQNTCMNNGYQNTTVETLPPIVTSSKNVVNTYHIQKQPYVHNYHTEVVHHHIKQAEFIPNYTCSETNVTSC